MTNNKLNKLKNLIQLYTKEDLKMTKNSYPSSEFEHKDRCPSCGSFCNIHKDLNNKDECNDCKK